MAGLTHNYVGLADRTLPTVGGKPKARSKSDWAWKPYRAEGSRHGRIRIVRQNADGITLTVKTVSPKPAKSYPRG